MITDSILTLKDKTILFVEDDEIIRQSTINTLKMLFGKVIEAADGQEALEKYVDERPDVVFTDIKMPVMDGIVLTEEIRKSDMDTPIVFFSSYSEQKYLLKAINLQVQGYIIKPAKLDDMISVFTVCSQKISNSKPSVIEFKNGVVYNMSTNELFNDGEKLSLSPKERAILTVLVKNYPKISTKEEMSSEVWPMEQISEITIKNTISRLRAKIGHSHIIAATGIGWRLEI